MTTGDRLRNIREVMGLTMQEFGERVGVTAGVVSRWESDKTKPSFDNMERLSQMGISVKVLFGADDAPVASPKK